MKSKTFLTSLVLTGAFALGVTRVNAQGADLNLGITPPLTHVVIQPGKTALTTVDIENQGAYDLKVTPQFVDFVSDNVSGNPVLEEQMSFPYIFLQGENMGMDKSFVLPKGTQRQLVFEINLPESTLEKEYHFSLVLETEPVSGGLVESTEAAVQGQVVSNFIVTVTESAQDQGKIELSSFEGPLFIDSFLPIQVKALVKNVGRNTTVTLGKFRVQNVFNQTVYENELLPENVLPNSTRELRGSESVLDGVEPFLAPAPLRYKGLFLLGPYKLILTYKSPSQEEQTFEHTVFALPISVLIFIIVIYILYLIYTKSGLFTLDRKKENTHTES
jgi:glutaredoxin